MKSLWDQNVAYKVISVAVKDFSTGWPKRVSSFNNLICRKSEDTQKRLVCLEVEHPWAEGLFQTPEYILPPEPGFQKLHHSAGMLFQQSTFLQPVTTTTTTTTTTTKLSVVQTQALYHLAEQNECQMEQVKFFWNTSSAIPTASNIWAPCKRIINKYDYDIIVINISTNGSNINTGSNIIAKEIFSCLKCHKMNFNGFSLMTVSYMACI